MIYDLAAKTNTEFHTVKQWLEMKEMCFWEKKKEVI